ncbi:hypothetical protein BC829DRAFT_402387 [Chytridium lagenaria]|nr:hypothetical protein BC829DRAFT_402387 [Chytridium lagenaria]
MSSSHQPFYPPQQTLIPPPPVTSRPSFSEYPFPHPNLGFTPSHPLQFPQDYNHPHHQPKHAKDHTYSLTHPPTLPSLSKYLDHLPQAAPAMPGTAYPYPFHTAQYHPSRSYPYPVPEPNIRPQRVTPAKSDYIKREDAYPTPTHNYQKPSQVPVDSGVESRAKKITVIIEKSAFVVESIAEMRKYLSHGYLDEYTKRALNNVEETATSIHRASKIWSIWGIPEKAGKVSTFIQKFVLQTASLATFSPYQQGSASDTEAMIDPVAEWREKRLLRLAAPARCSSCGATKTPEWRRGPNGPRTLCNACGLTYAKSRRRRSEVVKVPPAETVMGVLGKSVDVKSVKEEIAEVSTFDDFLQSSGVDKG